MAKSKNQSPSSRTLQALKRLGWHPATVEKYNHHTRTKNDLYGFIDIIAIHPDTGQVLAVQVTSGANVANRVTKITTECEPELRMCLKAGWLVEAHGWRELQGKGRQKWFCRKIEITTAADGTIQTLEPTP